MSIREAVATHWKSGIHWLGYSILGMVGLWGAALLLFSLSENPPWLKLIDQGQVFLYSVGLLMPALYSVQKERKITTFPFRAPLTFSCIVALVISLVLFTGMILASLGNISNGFPRIILLSNLGFLSLASSVVIGLLVAIFTEAREQLDLDLLGRQGPQRIGNEFDKIDGGA